MSPEMLFKSFNLSQLADLEQAFNAAWALIRPKQLVSGSLQEKEQKLALAGCIVAAAEDGGRDPDELKSTAIQLLILGCSA